MTIAIPLLVCIVGGIVHVTSAKLAQLGAWAFGVGLWWTLAEASRHLVHLGP